MVRLEVNDQEADVIMRGLEILIGLARARTADVSEVDGDVATNVLDYIANTRGI